MRKSGLCHFSLLRVEKLRLRVVGGIDVIKYSLVRNPRIFTPLKGTLGLLITYYAQFVFCYNGSFLASIMYFELLTLFFFFRLILFSIKKLSGDTVIFKN